jgi:hypothetical protein
VKSYKRNDLSKAVLTPGESIGGIEVNVHVVIRLDDKFRLLTEGGDPQLPEYILVGQVVIGIVKPALQTNLLTFFCNRE